MTARERNRTIAELRAILAGMKPTDPTRSDVERRLKNHVHERMREARARKHIRRAA